MEEEILASRLFKGISIEELRELLKHTLYVKKSYSKDSIIVFQNDRCINMILLYKGKAIGEKINYAGKVIVVEELHAPRVLAPAILYIKDNRYPVSVYAVEACEVILIPRDEFVRILQTNKQILFNFIEIISEQTYFLTKKLALYKLSLKGKIADFILQQREMSDNNEIKMWSHQRLANLFGVARPSLSRTITEMQQENIIEIENKIVKIKNLPALRKLAE